MSSNTTTRDGRENDISVLEVAENFTTATRRQPKKALTRHSHSQVTVRDKTPSLSKVIDTMLDRRTDVVRVLRFQFPCYSPVNRHVLAASLPVQKALLTAFNQTLVVKQ